MRRSIVPSLTTVVVLLSGLPFATPARAAGPDGSGPCLELVADTVPLDSPAGARIRKGPVVARNGDRFGVAWIDERSGSPEVRFASFDAAGNRIGEELRVDAGDEEPSLVPAGAGFAIAWVPNMVPFGEIRLEGLTAGGAPLGPATVADQASDQDHFVSLVSSGTELGLVWRDQQPDGANTDIHFARFALDGTPIGNATVVSDRPEFEDRPRLAWNGREYGVAWIDRWKRVLFARLSPEGVRIGEIRTVTDEAAALLFCDIAWGGDEWGIVANPDDRIVFRRVSASGDPVGSPIDLGRFHGFPSLAWNGRLWGVATDSFVVAFSRTGQRFGSDAIPLPGKGIDALGARRIVPVPGGFAVAVAPSSGRPLALVMLGCDE